MSFEIARSVNHIGDAVASPVKESLTRLGLARLLMDRPSTQKEAARLLAQVVQLDQGNLPAAFNLAVLRLKQGQAEETLHLLQPVLLANPNDAAALNLKGLALRAQKHFTKAAEAFRQATRADPGHAGAFYNLGALCATELKDLACARRAFKAFLALEPSSERAMPRST